MFDEFGGSGQQPHIPEPELVPILDALTAVIFFLLLSVTFIELTKITVPPSQTSVVTASSKSPPTQPKFFVKAKGNQLNLGLFWMGQRPDNIKKSITRSPANVRAVELEEAAHEMVAKFKALYPEEKAIQLSLSELANYQELISVMDGIRKEMQDIVLISPEDSLVFND